MARAAHSRGRDSRRSSCTKVLVDGSRRRFVSARGTMTLLMGEETHVNVERLLLQASEDELSANPAAVSLGVRTVPESYCALAS